MKPLETLVYYPGKGDEYRELLTKYVGDAIRLVVCDDESEIWDAIREAEVLLVATSFPTRCFAEARRVRWIQALGAGVERFVASGIPEGSVLTRVNTGFGPLIGEYVFGHLLASTQRIRRIAQAQSERKWRPVPVEHLRGEMLGVAGMGAIGSVIATRAKAFEMTVWGLDLQCPSHPALDRGFEMGQLAAFLASLRYLVLCLPLTELTRSMFGADQFRGMRDDAILVNVARGALVIEEDLVNALRTGEIHGAILDVFIEEPLPESSPLWSLPNAVVTPHTAGPSVPAEMVEFFGRNLVRFLNDEPLEGLVDVRRGF